MPRDMFHSFSSCDDRMALLRHESAPRRLEDLVEIEEPAAGMYVYVDNNGTDAKASLTSILNPDFVQSDWAEDDITKKSYIHNKPLIGEQAVAEAFESTATVGGISVGDIIDEGTLWVDVLKRILTGLGEEVDLWWTTTSLDPIDIRVPASFTGDQSGHTTISRHDLLTNGWKWPGRYKLSDERQVIAIKKSAGVKFDYMVQEGFIVSENEGFTCTKAGQWLLFHLDNKSTGLFSAEFHAVDTQYAVPGSLYFNTYPRRPLAIFDLLIPNIDSEGNELPWQIADVTRLGLLKDGFIAEDYGMEWPTPIDNEFAVIAVNDGLNLDCTSVKIFTDLDFEEEGLAGETLGNWKFYYLEDAISYWSSEGEAPRMQFLFEEAD